MSLDSIIRAVQKIMRKDSGVDGDAQRISQLVWMIFLKVFDSKEEEWELMDDNYKNIVPSHLQWRNWASNDEGITGDELIEFVNNRLFKELRDLEINDNDSPKKILVKSIFEDSFNYMKSGTLLRSVVNKLNQEIDFSKQSQRHLFNEIYETILRDLQSAGNAGEFYTPRAVTKFMIDMIDPKLGEKILDFACGTGGFLVSSIEKLKTQINNIDDMNIVQDSILGIEKKPLPYMLSVTNLILHDIDIPQIKHDNSLAINIRGIKQKDKVDIIVANPPFGGTEESSIMVNFPKNMQSEETSDLFLVLLANKIKEGGRAAIVLPDGFLSGDSSTKVSIKEMLLEKMELHTIVRLPIGVFSPYAKGVKTNLLFFKSYIFI
jgi:type I restriction enzyme M protein